MTQQLSELDEWKQAASVEAGLRREFYDKAMVYKADAERLRAALYEATTNGRWTEGEQRGEWAISNAVYETARDALNEQVTTPKEPQR